MATVPRYSQPTETATVLPNVRISDAPARAMAAAGEAIGAGGAAFGRALGGIAEHEQEKADTAHLMEAQQRLMDVNQQLLNDPDNGAFAQQGKNALGLSQRVLPDWDQQVAAITSAVPGRVRARFEQYAMGQRGSVAEQLARHTLTEGDKYYTATAKTTMEAFQAQAITNRTDPKLVDQAATSAGQAAVEWANRQGLDSAAVGKAAISTTYRGVLEATLAEDPDAAIKQYGTYKPLLTGVDQAVFEKQLNPYLLDTAARSGVDAWLAGAAPAVGSLPAPGAATSEAQAEAIARASVDRTLGLESGGKATATNAASSATGAGQFLKGTWLEVVRRNLPDVAAGKTDAQLLALRTDPAIARQATEAFALENCRKLFRAGLPVTTETAYLAHHFGADGAIALLRAPADAPCAQVLPPTVLSANPYLRGKTVSDLVANHASRAGEAAPGLAGAALGPDGKPDWGALLTRADALPNPLQRKAFVAEIEHRRAIANAAEAQQNAAMADAVYTASYAAPVGQKPEQYLSPTQLAWARRENHIEQLQAIALRRAGDQLVQTDPVIEDALARESVTDPAAFAKRNLLEFGEKLSTSDLATLRARQAAITKGDRAEQADWSSDQQRIVSVLRTLGQSDAPLAPDKVGQANAAQLKASDPKVAAVGSAYRQALAAFVTTHGKPTPAQKDELMRQVQTNLARDIAAGGWARVLRQQQAGELKASAGDAAKVAERFRARYGRAPTYAEVSAVLQRAYESP